MTSERWLKSLALASVLLFAGLTGYTLNALLDLQDELSADLGENMVWAASQASHQASLLQQAYLAPGALAGHRGNPVLQRALLKGRLSVLLSPTQAAFMQRAGVLEQLQQLQALIRTQQPDFAQVQIMLHDIGRKIMQTEREQAGERRDSYAHLLRQLIFFICAVMASGGVLGWLLLRSQARTRRALDEVARQHARTRELLDALELERETSLRYRDFVSVMSHQLRTPLAVIDSSAQRLMRQAHSSAVEQDVQSRSQRIRRSVRQLNQLIARALHGLRVDEHGQGKGIELDIVRCDWLEVVQQTLDNFGDLLAERRVNLSYAPGTSQPLWIECDRTWCAEILANLISNADKYSPPGSDIGIHLDSADGLLHCTVLNSGAEIPEQDLARLFERFFRGSHAERSSSGGIGLGLAIARTLAQWHKGSLNASRREGGGAAFTLQLPLRWSTAEAELV